MASSAVRRPRGLLEVFKFSLYLAIPVTMVYVIASPTNMKQLLEYKRYIVYPPEGPRPPTGTREDLARARAKEGGGG